MTKLRLAAIKFDKAGYDSLPKQQALDLFAMPELENVAIAC